MRIAPGMTADEANTAAECLVEVFTEDIDNLGHITAVSDDGTSARVEWFGTEAPEPSDVPLSRLTMTASAWTVVRRYVPGVAGARHS